MRRLSDVREDEAAVEFNMPVGDLDVLLPNLPEAEELPSNTPDAGPPATSTQTVHSSPYNCVCIPGEKLSA